MSERTSTPGCSSGKNAVPSTIGSAGQDLSPASQLDPAATRLTHCSCGRPARELLDGGVYGRTGYCGTPRLPIEPCDCGQGAERHDRSVCHVYGRGQAFELLLRQAVLEHGDDAPRLLEDGDNLRLTRPAWLANEAWTHWGAAANAWWDALLLECRLTRIQHTGKNQHTGNGAPLLGR